MKLVYTNSHPSDLLADERAGHLVRARELLAALDSLGHQVTIVEAAAGKGSQVAAATYHGPLRHVPRPILLAARDIARGMQSVVHGVRVARVARRVGADAIIETHNSTALAGAVATWISRRPLVLDDVTPDAEESSYYELGLPKLGRWIRRFALARAARLVTVSDTIACALMGEGFAAFRIAVVPNGTLAPADPAAGRAWRERLGIDADAPVVIYVGSFQEFHDVPLLVRALGRADAPAGAVAVLVGDGDLRPAVEQAVRSSGLTDRIRFVGRLPHHDVAGVLACADAAVLPGTAPYMNPMKLYEYVAAGLPVVAPDHPGVREILSEGARARLFPAGDAAAFDRVVAELHDRVSAMLSDQPGAG